MVFAGFVRVIACALGDVDKFTTRSNGGKWREAAIDAALGYTGNHVYKHRMATLFSIAAALAVSVAAPDYGSFKITDADLDRVTSHEYAECVDKSGGVTASMRDCSAAEFTRLDRALNIAYRDTWLGSIPMANPSCETQSAFG